MSGRGEREFDDAVGCASEADGIDCGVGVASAARRKAGERNLGGSGVGRGWDKFRAPGGKVRTGRVEPIVDAIEENVGVGGRLDIESRRVSRRVIYLHP